MNIAAVQGKVKKILSNAQRISLQMFIVIAAAILVAAGGVYLINTVLLDDSAINGAKSSTTRSTARGGSSLIAAVAMPQQKIRDLFHYSNELDVKPHAELTVGPAQNSGEKNRVAIDVPSYGNDVILKGIAKSGITKYALISYGGKTQVYRIGNSFGPYSVAKISDGNVVLNSPSGPITLNQQQLQSTAKQPKELTGGGLGEK
ncbi:MAG: hypothetical protein WCV63_00435 [Negativicutes bacterium]|jgi:type II secretory pathway component PulC